MGRLVRALQRPFGAFTKRCRSFLPSTASGFTIHLDYPPSRNFHPRWGHSCGSHEQLRSLFSDRHSEYCRSLATVKSLAPWLKRIPREFSATSTEPGWIGGPINAFDTAMLYSFVASLKPRTYVEIGSGVTTLFAARAKRDHGLLTRIISIDPEPRTQVDACCDEVVRSGLEECDLSIFGGLKPDDIVFVDGSHRSFMNSDVTVFMLDVLPALRPGVVVHFHDIFLPDDYPESFKRWYWNEQYLVAVYLLASRHRVRVLMPSFYVSTHNELRPLVEEIFSGWGERTDPWVLGGSLWITNRSDSTESSPGNTGQGV